MTTLALEIIPAASPSFLAACGVTMVFILVISIVRYLTR